MKKYILLIVVLFVGVSAFSQRRHDETGREKIQALKIAFITQKLSITTAEAEKFWPVYNNYEEEVREVAKNRNKEDVIKNEEKLLNIRKKYKPGFDKILGAQRANELFNVEREFRNVLINRLKSRGQQ